MPNRDTKKRVKEGQSLLAVIGEFDTSSLSGGDKGFLANTREALARPFANISKNTLLRLKTIKESLT